MINNKIGERCTFNQILFLVLLLFFGNMTLSQIREIRSFDEIKNSIEHVDTSTLVIFDCDETILMPTDPYLFTPLQNNPTIQRIRTDFIRHAATKQDPKDYSDAISAEVYTKARYRPVEQSMIDSINQLCQRGIRVIALTAQETGPMFGGRIPSFEEWRYARLKELGIDLSKSFSECSIQFKAFPTSLRGIPVFYKGILCTANYPKGEVLAAFLDYIGYGPNKVIFVDDTPEFVQSVAKAMKQKGILCEGYVYRASEFQIPKIESDIMQFQLDYIKNHNHIITYEEAKSLLKQQLNNLRNHSEISIH
jgi:hypothetical protein